MTTYQQLQKNNRYLRNEVGGQVALGRDSNNDIIVLALDSDGKIRIADTNVSSKRAYGFLTDIAILNVPFEIISLSSVTNKIIIKNILFSGNGLGQLSIEIDENIVSIVRNSYQMPSQLLNVPFELALGQELKAFVSNNSITQQMNSYELFLFYEEI